MINLRKVCQPEVGLFPGDNDGRLRFQPHFRLARGSWVVPVHMAIMTPQTWVSAAGQSIPLGLFLNLEKMHS